MPLSILPDRPFRTGVLALALFSLVCTRIPLLNYLGFEFSTLVTIPLGLSSGLLLLAWWKRTPPADGRAYWSLAGRSALATMVLALVPFLMMLANALLVRNCSLTDGLRLYAVITPGGGLFALGIAAVVAAVSDRWRRTLFLIAFVAVLAQIVVVTMLRPQIFAFNPVVGYFPGFTYDDSIPIAGRLFSYRLVILAATIVLLALGDTIRRWKMRHSEPEPSALAARPVWRIDLLLLAAFTPMLIVVIVMSDRIGFSSSDEFIRDRLGGHIRTAHAEMVYPSATLSRERAQELADLQEYYDGLITRTLGVPATQHITTYLYESPEQKARYIGASRTDIAKPWLGQIHLNAGDSPSVLKHEMTHVLARPMGIPWVGIASTPGLIEGTAVAVENASAQEPLDRAAALVFAAGAAPDLSPLFTVTGFVTSSPGVSYTLAGAFCRDLMDRYGMERYRLLYQTGDFSRVYGVPLDSLLHAWRASIDTVRLSAGDSVKAVYLFRRPSIFAKECARVIAGLTAETGRLLAAHDDEAALRNADRSLRLSRQPDAVYQKSRALYELKRYRELITFDTAMLADSLLGGALLPLRLRLGDAYWAEGKLDSAREQYRRVEETHLSVFYDEACALRRAAIASGHAQAAYWTALTRAIPDSFRMTTLLPIRAPLAYILLGQIALGQEQFSECLQWLQAAGPMQDPVLEYLRLRRMARSRFELGDYDRARSLYENARPLATGVQRAEIDEWIDRCRWSVEHLH